MVGHSDPNWPTIGRADHLGFDQGDSAAIPEDCRWPVLRDLQEEKLPRRYSAILETLYRPSGIVGTIFLKAQNEIQDSAKLRRLVGLIESGTWLGLGVDIKGSIYEGCWSRTNQRVTLKKRAMTRADLHDFVACYKSGRRHERAQADRLQRFVRADLIGRDKINFDRFGSGTTRWTTRTSCRSRMRSPPRLSRISKRRSTAFARLR